MKLFAIWEVQEVFLTERFIFNKRSPKLLLIRKINVLMAAPILCMKVLV